MRDDWANYKGDGISLQEDTNRRLKNRAPETSGHYVQIIDGKYFVYDYSDVEIMQDVSLSEALSSAKTLGELRFKKDMMRYSCYILNKEKNRG